MYIIIFLLNLYVNSNFEEPTKNNLVDTLFKSE